MSQRPLLPPPEHPLTLSPSALQSFQAPRLLLSGLTSINPTSLFGFSSSPLSLLLKRSQKQGLMVLGKPWIPGWMWVGVSGLCLCNLYEAFNFTVKTAPVGILLRISETENCHHFLIKKEHVRAYFGASAWLCLSEPDLWIKQLHIQVGANVVKWVKTGLAAGWQPSAPELQVGKWKAS